MATLKFDPPKINTPVAHYEWNCDHAAITHNGAVMRNGTRIPARPWCDVAIAETDLGQVFRKHYGATESLQAAWELTAFETGDRFKEMISSERWQWDGITHRRNGETVGSPRNIVDTRELLESQTLELR